MSSDKHCPSVFFLSKQQNTLQRGKLRKATEALGRGREGRQGQTARRSLIFRVYIHRQLVRFRLPRRKPLALSLSLSHTHTPSPCRSFHLPLRHPKTRTCDGRNRMEIHFGVLTRCVLDPNQPNHIALVHAFCVPRALTRSHSLV